MSTASHPALAPPPAVVRAVDRRSVFYPRTSSALLALVYAFAILSDLTIVKQWEGVQNALYAATFFALALCGAYLWQSYRLRHPVETIRANRWLLLYLLGLVAVQAVFHRLGAGLYMRLLGYAATALLAYLLVPAVMLPRRHLVIAWIRIVAVASAVLSIFGLLSQFGLETIAGIPFATKTAGAYSLFGIHATGGVLETPIRLGTQAVLGVGAALYLLHRRRSAVNLALLVTNGVGVLISFSRAAWLAAVVGLLYVFLTRDRWEGRISVYLTATLAVGLLLFSVYELATRWSLLGQLLRLDYGLSHRELTWPFAMAMILLRPLVGYGFLSAERVKMTYGADVLPELALDASFENNFIDMAVQSGLLVAALYGLVFLIPIYRALTSRLELGFRRLLIFTSIAVTVSVMFTNYNIGGLRSTSLAATVFLGLANLGNSRLSGTFHAVTTSQRHHHNA